MMQIKMKCDFLVAGGGYSGICAAIQGGRLGMKTILVEKEMMLGGNGGPNLGVGTGGAMICNPYWNETGIIEEIEERVNYRKARMFPTNFGYNIHPMWDDVIAQMLEEAGVTVLRRHIVTGCRVEDQIIREITILNIENLNTIEMEISGFVLDATGDAFVADLSGAAWRMGRESRKETGERSAPGKADDIISTASITAVVVDSGIPNEFIPPENTPPWNAEKPDNHFDPKKKIHFLWQVDEGGESAENHSLYTPQELYRRLTGRIYSVWNYLKNIKYPEEAINHQLIWISPILGRRESRRIEGDYLVTQTDVENCRIFPDSVGFSGHYLDEHLPSYDGGYEVRYYMRPLPFDIPLRSIYSCNISNLFSGGRAIGVSHLVFTSTRLMRTAGVLGQSAAVAARLCMEMQITPGVLASRYADILQQNLLKNDVFIIGVKNEDEKDLARRAKITASSEGSISRNTVYTTGEMLSQKPLSEWKSANPSIAAAVFDYPQRIEKAAFYIRNSSNETIMASGFLGYGECSTVELMPVPEFVYNAVTGRYEERKENAGTHCMEARSSEYTPTGSAGWAEYYKRDDNITKYDVLLEEQQLVSPGFEGWVTFNLLWTKGFADFDRSKAGQAVILGISGDIEVLTAPSKVDVMEGLFGENGHCSTNISAIPVFRLIPDHVPGQANNLINGIIHRYGRARLNQWMSNPEESLPQWIRLDFDREIKFSKIQIRFDVTERLWKDMYILKGERTAKRLVSDYQLEVLTENGWEVIVEESENFRRFREHIFSAPQKAKALRLNVLKVWGQDEPARVYEIRIE